MAGRFTLGRLFSMTLHTRVVMLLLAGLAACDTPRESGQRRALEVSTGTAIAQLTAQLTLPQGKPRLRQPRVAVTWLRASEVGVLPILAARGGGVDAGVNEPSPSLQCGGWPTSEPPLTANYDILGSSAADSELIDDSGRATLPLSRPPESSLVDLAGNWREFGGHGHIALALVHAYEDVDHNETLTLGSPGTGGDDVVATSWGHDPLYVVFLDGALGPGSLPIPDGFSLVRQRGGSVLPLSNPVELVVGQMDGDGSPPQIFGCSQLLERRSGNQPFWVMADNTTNTAGSSIECSLDGRSYLWRSWRFESCVADLSYGAVCTAPTGPTPAGWPCP